MAGILTNVHETEYNIEVDWKIEISPILNTSSYDCLSPSFTWSAIEWRLKIVRSIEPQKAIKLYLRKYTAKSVQVEFKLGIGLIDGTSEIRCSLVKHFDNSESDSFGTLEFILDSEIIDRKDELLSNDILTVVCSIAYPKTLTKCIKYENLEVLSSNFKTLYGCTESSDVTLIVGEQSYPVHKTILAARSDVFAAMLKHNMKELNSGIIKVADCDSTSFKDFLLYLYTGKVENFSSDNACHLYRTADKYNVTDLKDLCLTYLERNISMTNLFDIVSLANLFNKTKLLSLAQQFFNRNALEIIRGNDWKQFIEQNFYIANQLLISMLEKT